MTWNFTWLNWEHLEQRHTNMVHMLDIQCHNASSFKNNTQHHYSTSISTPKHKSLCKKPGGEHPNANNIYHKHWQDPFLCKFLGLYTTSPENRLTLANWKKGPSNALGFSCRNMLRKPGQLGFCELIKGALLWQERTVNFSHTIHGTAIFTCTWLIFMVNVSKYTIHGCYGFEYWQKNFWKSCTYSQSKKSKDWWWKKWWNHRDGVKMHVLYCVVLKLGNDYI